MKYGESWRIMVNHGGTIEFQGPCGPWWSLVVKPLQVLAEAAHKDLMTQRKAALKFEVPVAAGGCQWPWLRVNIRQSNRAE